VAVAEFDSSPDSVQEFKVRQVYDAEYGRFYGANVTLVMNKYKISMDVFLSSSATVLNANDFLNRTGQPRPVLKQNQFACFGGPTGEDKLLFLVPIRVRQVNGIVAGQFETVCTASLSEPPLTDDRSASELGNCLAA
jgi:hypothetical protein